MPAPQCEMDMFGLILVLARRLAEQGNPSDGYTALLAGFGRVRTALQAGEPWAEDLAARYQEALDRYAETHGIARG